MSPEPAHEHIRNVLMAFTQPLADIPQGISFTADEAAAICKRLRIVLLEIDPGLRIGRQEAEMAVMDLAAEPLPEGPQFPGDYE